MTYGKRPPLDEQKSLWESTVAREGVTTGPGAVTGDSFIDAGLAGVGANSFVSMLAIIYPGQPRNVDSMDITAFNNATGEVTLAKAYKGVAAAIPVGVPYKIVTFRFVPAEVAALAAALAAHEAAQAISRGEVTSIETKVDDLDADLVAHEAALAAHEASQLASRGEVTSIETKVDAVEVKLDTPANFMADVAALALEATLDTHDVDIKALLATIAGYIDLEVAAIKAVTDALPNAGALTDLAAIKLITDALPDAGALTDLLADADPRVMGRAQIAVEAIDLDNTAIGTYNTLIGTTQNVIIESLIFRCTRDLSGDAGFTGISLQTDDTTNQVFVSQADGVKANLTADSQLAWTGAILLKVGQYIDFSVYGGAVANLESLCDIVVTYRAVVSGGHLA